MVPHFQPLGDIQISSRSQGTQLRVCLARSVKGGSCTSNPFSPYPVTGPTVAPTAFHLPKSSDAALLAAEAAARPVDEVHTRLWVYCEMEEEAHHLPVSQDTRLRRTCRVDFTHGGQMSAN